MSDFIAWLDSVTCTAPFTLADTKELYTLIRSAVPKSKVDVYISERYNGAPTKVHVRVEHETGVIEREIDVV